MKHKLFFALAALLTVCILGGTTTGAVHRYCKNNFPQETGSTERLFCETEYEGNKSIHS